MLSVGRNMPTTVDLRKESIQWVQEALTQEELRYGPNIADWPGMYPLTRNLLLAADSLIHDP